MNFDFDKWQAEQDNRRIHLQDIVQKALANQGLIGERIYQNRTHVWPWCSPFYAEYSTPDYIAEHLTSRHFGFGWNLIIDGIEYHMGREVTQ